MSHQNKRHIYIPPVLWRRIQVAARRSSIMEGRSVSASEVLRLGAEREVGIIERRFEKEHIDA